MPILYLNQNFMGITVIIRGNLKIIFESIGMNGWPLTLISYVVHGDCRCNHE